MAPVATGNRNSTVPVRATSGRWFFDHYLKETQPAQWMVEGVPYLDRDYANPREMVDGTIWGKPPKEEKPEKVERGGRGG